MNCNICGKEMKLIPAGISKKNNKPYGAFYSCWACKKTSPAVEPQHNQGRQISLEQFEQDLSKINRNIQSIVKKIQEMEKKIGGLETCVAGSEGKEALELHTALEDSRQIRELKEEIPIISEELF